MSLSPHQVLAKLSENECVKTQEEIATLARERQSLEQQHKNIEIHIQKLRQQREKILKNSTQASTLMMMNDAMQEDQTRLYYIDQNMTALDEQEAELLSQWVAAHQQQEVHDKMFQSEQKKKLKVQERRVQQGMDDMFAARHSRKDG